MSNRETLEIINKRLLDYYGSESDLPNWRVSWSPDQWEHRHGYFEDRTTDGFFIRAVTETRWVPKYDYFAPKWILEFLREVTPDVQLEIPENKLSYECAYAFPYHKGEPLMPIWPALRVVIDQIHDRAGVTGPRYQDPLSDPKIAAEVKEARLRELEEELFGDETDVGDALAYHEGVGYTTAQNMRVVENNNDKS